jgi:hypothetical protein
LLIAELRARAEAALALAAEADLPNVRAAHERAAAKWLDIALGRERALTSQPRKPPPRRFAK